MNCERCQNELEDFLYGELGFERAAGVSKHLAECAACAALRDDIERENELFARFYEQTAIEPSSEMWEAIRARVNLEPRGEAQNEAGWLERLRVGMFGWTLAPATLRQVAFAILLIALSVALTTVYLKRDEKGGGDVAGGRNNVASTPTLQEASQLTPQLPTTPKPVSSPLTDVAEDRKPLGGASTSKGVAPLIDRHAPARRLSDQELMNQQIARAEREYQKAIRMLDQALAKRRDSLDQALIKQYESSLMLINNSIAESRQALRQRPGDPIAGQFLLAAYAKKLELMQEIAMQ
jgi:hypothetical protein